MAVFIGASLIFFVIISNAKCEIFVECDGVESQSFIASPSDCESYIYCDDEESFVAKCPDDQRFNAEMGICDDPENVECLTEETTEQPKTTLKTSTQKPTTETRRTTKKTFSSTKSSSTISSSSTTLPSTLRPLSSSSVIPLNDEIICPTPSSPDEIVYLPNSKSCSKYFLCYNKSAIPMTCPRDLEFNVITKSCDLVMISNCKINRPTTTSPRELCTGNKSGYMEYPNNCHYYYRCMNGLLTIQECPSGFGWDAVKKMCSSTACRK